MNRMIRGISSAASEPSTLALPRAAERGETLKINSMESGNFALIETAKALAGSGFKLVPDIVAGGGAADGGGSLVNVLLANLIASSHPKAVPPAR